MESMNKLKQATNNYQKKYILKALRANHGNVTVTAKRLNGHKTKGDN